MADFTISVPDAAVARIREAMGRNVDGTWTPATPVEVRDAIRNHLKSLVLNYEARLVAEAKSQEVGAENWTA